MRLQRYGIWLAALAGAATTLAFAPRELFPLAMLGPAVLFLLWDDAVPRQAAKLGFAWGAGLFLAGTWWIYTAVHDFGGTPAWMAALILLVPIAVMGSYYALLGWIVDAHRSQAAAAAFPAAAAGRMDPDRMAARLAAVRIPLAATRLRPQRQPARSARAGRRHPSRGPREHGLRRRAARAAARQLAGTRRRARCHRRDLGRRLESRVAAMDDTRGRGGQRRAAAGRDPAGREVADGESPCHARSLSRIESPGTGSAADRLAGVRVADAGTRSGTLSCSGPRRGQCPPFRPDDRPAPIRFRNRRDPQRHVSR